MTIYTNTTALFGVYTSANEINNALLRYYSNITNAEIKSRLLPLPNTNLVNSI